MNTRTRNRLIAAAAGVFLALGAVDYVTNGAISGEPYGAANATVVAHSTTAAKKTAAAPKPKAAGKPKTGPTTVPGYEAITNRLSQRGDDNGAYCTVVYGANPDGTLHLAALLGEKATVGAIVLDAQTASGGDWSDSYELVSAKAQGDPMNAGMDLTHQWDTSVKLHDVRKITAQLAPDDESSIKVYDCEVFPTPSLSTGKTDE